MVIHKLIGQRAGIKEKRTLAGPTLPKAPLGL
jgi:hypothetical protein